MLGQSARLIFAYGSFTKSLMRAVDNKEPTYDNPSSSSYGAVAHRDRSLALDVQQGIRDRVKVQNIFKEEKDKKSVLTTFYDNANAFNCPKKEILRARIDKGTVFSKLKLEQFISIKSQ